MTDATVNEDASARIPAAKPVVSWDANKELASLLPFHHEKFKFVASKSSFNAPGPAARTQTTPFVKSGNLNSTERKSTYECSHSAE
jgi:hypothetical protein